MTTDGRFPRVSADGLHVACGALNLSIDGVVVGPGTTPIWVSETDIAHTRQPDGALMWRDRDGEIHELQAAAHEPSSLCASKFGRLAWREKDGVHATNRREGVVPGAFRPTWSGTDLCWCLDTGTTADLYREGALVARNVHDVRGMPDGRLCYTQQDGAESWTCIQYPDGRIESWRLAGAQEYRPLVLDIGGEAWVLSHTRDDRLLLRTGNNGIVVHVGATFDPDAAVLADGRVRIVWADERDRLVDRLLTPLTKTTFGLSGEGMDQETRIVRDLRVKPQPTVAPWPPGAGWTRRDDIDEIDIVGYLLGSQDWSRNGMHVLADGVTYTHPFQSRTGPGWVQHTKFDPPDTRAATWTVSEHGIGLAHDGTNELAKGYRFINPGTADTAPIYPRRMRVGPQHRHVVPVEILNLDTPDAIPRRVRFAGWVERMWENTAPIGDIPAGTLHAEIMFEPAWGEDSGWRERNLCISGGGSWYWDSHRKAPGAVPHMRWIGSRNASRVPDPPVRYAEALPVAAPVPPPIPEPEPDPMPTLPTHLTLRSAHGRYLCAESGGGTFVVADREVAGPWETWRVVPGHTPTTVALQASDGHYLCAHEGGGSYVIADRQSVGPWESWRVERHGDGIALRADTSGLYLCAEFGGSVTATRTEAHAWEIWIPTKVEASVPTQPDPPTEPLPDPGPSQVLPVVVDGRILRTTDGAALDYREASFFMVLARWLGQNGGSPQQMIDAFRAWRGMGINTLRGFVSIGHPDFWRSRGWLLTPRTPGIYKALHDCTVAAAAEGIRMRWTLLADTGDVFRDTADVRGHVIACMDALRGLPCIIEVCNEPTMNGYGSDWAVVLADLARSLDESAIVALGPEHGATGHLATADRAPADLVFFHVERRTGESGYEWLRRLGEYGVVRDGKRPALSGEPINAGDEGAPGDYQNDPAIWFCYGALSRMVPSHGYAPTFHYHGGLWAELPNQATRRCLDAFIAGCNAVPLSVREWAWANGHHGESPWRGYDQTDPPSDNRPSRIYGRRSGGAYWGVSIREPKGWSWPDLRYPVTRVARVEGERFDCSVWMGQA